MAFDEEMRPHFLALARALRAPGAGLNKLFRDYLAEAARHLEAGDFEALLRADLAQNGQYGKLYFSVFPHEGYWADNLKFPLTLAVGIRDESSLVPTGPGFTELLNSLASRVQTVAEKTGLDDYQAPVLPLKPKEEDGSMVGLWTLMTAGFKRAFMRDPGGHDYPKREYPGVVDHRNVILFDTVETWAKLVTFMAKKFLGAAASEEVSFEGLLRFVFLHEAVHGAQIRLNSATLLKDAAGGRVALAEAFGDWWGILVEPWADAGAVLGCSSAADAGLMSDAERRQCVLAAVSLQFVRLRPRADLRESPTAAPHLTGASMFLTMLILHGGMVCDIDKVPLCSVNLDRGERNTVDSVASMLFDGLTRMAAGGRLGSFKQLVNLTLDSDTEQGMSLVLVEEKLLAYRALAPSYNLLDRGDLPAPRVQEASGPGYAEL